VMQLFPRTVFSLFTKDAVLLDSGVRYLRSVSFIYIPMSLHFILQGVMRGAGDTIPTMLIALGALWMIRLPSALVMSGPFGMGILGVWLAFPMSGTFTLIMNYIYYKRGKWASKRLIRHEAIQASLDDL
ncbi:MAG TPA: MATE family efflux transporter, partial [Bacillota bacterium]|nr:MATE family efflux transporter [Bacillota bacterium]